MAEKLFGVIRERTLPGGIKRPHVEDVNALHLSDEFETLEAGGMLNVGRDGTGLGTWGDEVLLGLDLCYGKEPVSIIITEAEWVDRKALMRTKDQRRKVASMA
jgi:hypothetical protein